MAEDMFVLMIEINPHGIFDGIHIQQHSTIITIIVSSDLDHSEVSLLEEREKVD